jgi:serine/threonine protein kinase
MGSICQCFKPTPSQPEAEDIDEPFISKDEPTPSSPISLDSFQVEKQLGKGTFGKVMLVRKKDNGKIFAMKIIKKALIEKYKHVDHTKTERKVLEELSHPFLVKLRYAFQSKTKLYMVMDFINGGELFYHLKKSRVFSVDRARFYAAEILIALEYLHSQGVVYRDLKAENILIDTSGHIKLTDFGLSKKFFAPENFKTYSFCGTPEYLAPEILLGVGHDKSVDYWSLGVLIFEMLSGELPFFNPNKQELYKSIVKAEYQMKTYFSPDSQDLIQKLLEPNVRST